LPLLAGVATIETLRRLAEVDAVLKWPNDVLVRVGGAEAKCAGILAEVVDDAVVLGVGINVTTRADELPPPTGLPSNSPEPTPNGPADGLAADGKAADGLAATSLRLAGAAAYDRDPLLRSLLRGLARWYEAWRAADGDVRACGLLAAYREGSATVGRDVRVLLPSGDVFGGEARTVDADGQLVVRTADGERRVSAGDVLHVR
jgi:BirA family biotin operon repressor/biotin-[acetyl-CoA-carboxylase] ligase